MTKLFISYCHSDKDFVDRLVYDLRRLGADVWIDTVNIGVGESLLVEISKGIDSVDYVGAIISSSSVSSPWVQRELDIAMNQEIEGRRVKVLPLLIDDVELPGFMRGKKYADFRKKENYSLELGILAAQLDLAIDVPPVVPNWTPDPAPWDTLDARRIQGRLFNQAGMSLMKYSGKYQEYELTYLYPESWRRRDDGASYAFEIGDREMYDSNVEEMNVLEDKYAPIRHLFSPAGLVMREAVRLFRRSAGCGDPEGHWNLGWRYRLGQGVVKNGAIADYYWACAARLGHGEANRELVERGIDAERMLAESGDIRFRVLENGLE